MSLSVGVQQNSAVGHFFPSLITVNVAPLIVPGLFQASLSVSGGSRSNALIVKQVCLSAHIFIELAVPPFIPVMIGGWFAGQSIMIICISRRISPIFSYMPSESFLYSLTSMAIT